MKAFNQKKVHIRSIVNVIAQYSHTNVLNMASKPVLNMASKPILNPHVQVHFSSFGHSERYLVSPNKSVLIL